MIGVVVNRLVGMGFNNNLNGPILLPFIYITHICFSLYRINNPCLASTAPTPLLPERTTFTDSAPQNQTAATTTIPPQGVDLTTSAPGIKLDLGLDHD